MIKPGEARGDPRLDDEKLKRRYAAELLRQPGEPYAAAAALLPGGQDINVTALMGQLWPTDAIVIEEMNRLREELGDAAGLPSKERYLLEIYEMGRDRTKTVTERLAAYKLVGDVMGFTPRPGVQQLMPVTPMSNKVMKVREFESELDWQKGASVQQQQLIEDAKRATIQ